MLALRRTATRLRDHPLVARLAGRVEAMLPQTSFLKAAATIVAGTGLAQLIVLLGAPIVTRLYSPADYGVYAVATSVLAVLISIVCLRYEFAIPLPESESTAAHVLALCLTIATALSIVFAVGLLLLGSRFLSAFGGEVLEPYVVLLAIGGLGGGVVSAFTTWAIRTQSFGAIVANRLSQSGGLIVTQLGLGVLGAGAPGLVLGAIVGSIAGSTRLARDAWRRSESSFREISVAEMRRVAVRYRRFPLFSAPSALINTLGLEAPVLLIVGLYGTDAGGEFALAQRVIALPVTLISTAVGQVYFAELARLRREEPAGMLGLFWRTTRSLALPAAPLFAVGAVASYFLFGPIFGDRWQTAGVYVAILAPAFFMQFVANPTGGTLDVLERQDQILVREIVRLILAGGAVVAAAGLALPATTAIAALSIAGCLTYLIYASLSWRTIRVQPVVPGPIVADPDHEDLELAELASEELREGPR